MAFGMLVLAGTVAIAATAFVVMTLLWLKKLRETVFSLLGETAGQQIRTAQRLNERLALIEKRHRLYERQIDALASANARLQHELVEIAGDADPLTEADDVQHVSESLRTIH
jgi:hypothetical protein